MASGLCSAIQSSDSEPQRTIFGSVYCGTFRLPLEVRLGDEARVRLCQGETVNYIDSFRETQKKQTIFNEQLNEF